MDIGEIATKQDVAKMLLETEQRILKAILGKIKFDDDSLDIDAAARYIGAKSRSTIYKLTSSGQLAYHKAGKKNAFRKADLDRYIARHRKSSNEELAGAAALHGVQ